MKRTFVVCAALLLTFLMADARTVKKVYELDDFTGIRAGNAFEVILERSRDFRVEVEISEEFLPYLQIRNRGGVLELDFMRLPFRLRQKNRNKEVRAVISMPELTHIELTGASKLSCNDQFGDAMHRFTIDLKGGSTITNLNLKTPEVAVRLAGASKALLNLRSGDVDAELGGASRLELAGESAELDLKVSGASRVMAADFEAEEVEVKASGASSVDVRATRVLSVELSGASRCRYHGDDGNLRVRAGKIAGASTLKHEN